MVKIFRIITLVTNIKSILKKITMFDTTNGPIAVYNLSRIVIPEISRSSNIDILHEFHGSSRRSVLVATYQKPNSEQLGEWRHMPTAQKGTMPSSPFCTFNSDNLSYGIFVSCIPKSRVPTFFNHVQENVSISMSQEILTYDNVKNH